MAALELNRNARLCVMLLFHRPYPLPNLCNNKQWQQQQQEIEEERRGRCKWRCRAIIWRKLISLKVTFRV